MRSQKTFWFLIAVTVFCCLLPFIVMWIWKVETLASTPGQSASAASSASPAPSQSKAAQKPAAK